MVSVLKGLGHFQASNWIWSGLGMDTFWYCTSEKEGYVERIVPLYQLLIAFWASCLDADDCALFFAEPQMSEDFCFINMSKFPYWTSFVRNVGQIRATTG